MVTRIIMPQAGETMNEGRLVRWLKKEGDVVKRGEPLLEIETDKAQLEVEASGNGYLRKILVHEGDTVPVLTLLGLLADKDESISDEREAAQRGQTTESPKATVPTKPEPSAPATGVTERAKVSPIARRLARELGVDLRQVRGSGPGGRIVRTDVESAPKKKLEATVVAPGDRVVPLSRMRRAIAARMKQSKASAPHFYVTTKVNAAQLVALREQLVSAADAGELPKISYTEFVVRAVAKTLARDEFHMLNSSTDEENVTLFGDVNVGIAVGVAEGILLPAIANPHRKPFNVMATEIRDLIDKARMGKTSTSPSPTFTVTNMGRYDVESFGAIIVPPQTAILAVASIVREPVADGDEVRIAPVMRLTLSADHRVVDGVLAAQFLSQVKKYLEAPAVLLLG